MSQQKIKTILEQQANQFIEKEISKIRMDENSLKYSISKIISNYRQQLGFEFIKESIPFTSLFDKGYADDYLKKYTKDKEEKKFAKHYINFCKTNPHADFLEDILDRSFQRDFLLKIIQEIDFKKEFQDSTDWSGITNTLRDFKTIGINSLIVNKEVTEIVSKLYLESENSNPNHVIVFIYEGFSFNDETIKVIKKDFYTCFSYKTNLDDDWNKLAYNNLQNKIEIDHKNLSEVIGETEHSQKNKKAFKI